MRTLSSVLSGAIIVMLLATRAAEAAPIKEELAALEGTWESTPVAEAGGSGKGSIKLQLTAAKDGAMGGRGSMQITSKRGGSSSSSSRTFTFRLAEKGADHLLIAPGPAGTGLALTYRLENDQLILTGRVTSRRVAYNLKNVALKRAANK